MFAFTVTNPPLTGVEELKVAAYCVAAVAVVCAIPRFTIFALFGTASVIAALVSAAVYVLETKEAQVTWRSS
jgi:hypothetical protein